jgi:dimethylglycine dehydrogenase
MIEADMERFVNFDKGDFVGRDALLKRREAGVNLKLVYLSIETEDADSLGNEPISAEGRSVGITTSGGYGFAYVEPAFAAPGTALEVTMLGEGRPARVLEGPAYDPKNERLRA